MQLYSTDKRKGDGSVREQNRPLCVCFILLGQKVFEETVKFLIKALHQALDQEGVVLIKEHELCYGLAVIIYKNE